MPWRQEPGGPAAVLIYGFLKVLVCILRNSVGVQSFICLNIRIKDDMLEKPELMATSVMELLASDNCFSARAMRFWLRNL